MKKIKNYTLSMLCIVVVLMSISACTGRDSSSPDGQNESVANQNFETAPPKVIEVDNPYEVREEIPKNAEKAVVSGVIDGDTFTVGKRTIGLLGVNFPNMILPGEDTDDPLAKTAKDYLREAIGSKTVYLSFDGQTDGDRELAYVYLENGIMLNRTLIREGYAKTATNVKNHDYAAVFKAAQKVAKFEGLGLWRENE